MVDAYSLVSSLAAHQEFSLNITCYISRKEYKAKLSTSRRKRNEVFGSLLALLSLARESADENALRQGSGNHSDDGYRHAFSGRPRPGHIIDAADTRVSKDFERSRGEI